LKNSLSEEKWEGKDVSKDEDRLLEKKIRFDIAL